LRDGIDFLFLDGGDAPTMPAALGVAAAFPPDAARNVGLLMMRDAVPGAIESAVGTSLQFYREGCCV
jgi:hypothetical protein